MITDSGEKIQDLTHDDDSRQKPVESQFKIWLMYGGNNRSSWSE